MSETIQVIVHYNKSDIDNKRIKRLGKVKYDLPMISACVLEVNKRNLGEIKRLHEVEKFELDTHITAQMKKTGDMIKLNYAHEHGIFGDNIGVAVLDTGIYEHTDFIGKNNKSRIIEFVDFVNNRKGIYDDNGHGTHVGGS